MRHLPVILLGVVAAHCASNARPALQPQPDVAPADALVESGCYRCLQEAYGIYERAMSSPVPPPGIREKVFATSVLLAMREKELGLDAARWMERAAGLATADEMRYLDVVSRLPWTNAGSAVDFDPPRRLLPSALPEWLSEPPSATHQLLEQYVLAALRCTFGGGTLAADVDARLDLSRPLIRYRTALCGLAGRQPLQALVATDPRFVEALFFIGRYELAASVRPAGIAPDPADHPLVRALPALLSAHEGLPEAPIVTIVLANLMRSRTELPRALALYDEALALRPTQRDALLGRVITLTYLERAEEAIAAAGRLIELGSPHVGSGFYWRAWNQYQQGRLEAAAADIARAKGLLINDDVMTLSGMVAYDQKRAADARADFDDAVRMNPEKCIARWYLGLLNLDEEAWLPAVSSFGSAGGCYQRAADTLRSEIARLPADLPADVRAQQLTTFDRNISASLRQAGRSFFNAAQASLRVGDTAAAAAHAHAAAGYEEMKERAEVLIETLERNR